MRNLPQVYSADKFSRGWTVVSAAHVVPKFENASDIEVTNWYLTDDLVSSKLWKRWARGYLTKLARSSIILQVWRLITLQDREVTYYGRRMCFTDFFLSLPLGKYRSVETKWNSVDDFSLTLMQDADSTSRCMVRYFHKKNGWRNRAIGPRIALLT